MILTCPACDTKYVVKDGAIPPKGRQVRCAACKHSWHQQPDDDVMASAPVEDAPSQTDAGSQADERHPETQGLDGQGDAAPFASDPSVPPQASDEGASAPAVPEAEPPFEPQGDDGWDTLPDTEEERFEIPPMDAEDEPERRGLKLMLVLALLAIVAAIAFWFLAPESLKARVGLAEAKNGQLQLMLTTSDRQELAQGQELLAISGRIINPTDREQAVPPIQAALRDKATHKLVYRWTIPPPAPSLAPRTSASFNSAELNVPRGGDEVVLSLGTPSG